MRHRIGLLAAGTALVMTATAGGAAVASAPGGTGGSAGKPSGSASASVKASESASGKTSASAKGKGGDAGDGKDSAKGEGKGEAKGPAKGKGKGPGKGPGKDKADGLDAVAKRYGVSPGQLDNALRDVKRLLGGSGAKVTDPAVVRVLAADLGISTAKAQRLLKEIFGADSGAGKPAPKPGEKSGFASVVTAKGLAGILGVSVPKAQTAVNSLAKLVAGPKGTIDEGSPAYAAVAAKLGVTPARLTQALVQLKVAAAKRPGGDR